MNERKDSFEYGGPSSSIMHVLGKQVDDAKKREATAKEASLVDDLTGVSNSRALGIDFPEISKHLESGEEKRGPDQVRFFFLDIDKFKTLNDKYGHLKGDEALKILAGALKSEARLTDKLFRYGGDEFIIIQMHKGETHITPEEIASNIENSLNEKLVLPVEGGDVHFSVSVGCSVYNKGEHKTLKELQDEADHAMYFKKGSKK